MRVAIIAGGPTADSAGPVCRQTASLLRAWGCSVDLLQPDHESLALVETTATHDVMFLGSASAAAMSTSGVYHALGAHLRNPYPTVLAASDVAVATRTLQLAGLDVPPTWLTIRPRELSGLLRQTNLIIRSGYGRRSRLVTTADDLPLPDGAPFIVQRWQASDEPPVTVLRIGDAVFWAGSGTASTSMISSALLRDLAAEAGEAFGTDLISITVVMSAGRPYVVDVSAVPDLHAVPEAGLRLAEYLYAAAKSATAAGEGDRR